MSKAAKCDRCKGFFRADDVEESEMIRIPEVIYYDSEKNKNNCFSKRVTELDLCPRCTRAFDWFMDGDQIMLEIRQTEGAKQ